MIKNRIWKNFREGARPVRPPLNPPLSSVNMLYKICINIINIKKNSRVLRNTANDDDVAENVKKVIVGADDSDNGDEDDDIQ